MPRMPRPELADARQQGLHNIGEAARQSGVSAKMIRHYESIGLIPPPNRTFAGYRLYNDADLHRLGFIRRARGLGFSIRQIEALLGLWDDRSRASAEVKRLAQSHVDELAEKIAEMQAMQRTLQDLARRCHGDDRPDCPILEDLAAAPDADADSSSQRGAGDAPLSFEAGSERRRAGRGR
ncbi:Cu(I)-responsive transcriptional regulator [Lysobacter auxotrophicus]|uniref:Cu(I)-responsive transcriptional regulator n=1 Tax=Lysobacter auxotrophicus TaxID=2992573 RepID=A0ABM8DCS2_9GAMM|nr:Cu(I)-responsive transcriptional regulator [Lysobacter auxotrophicus]BDU16388.1 Cu(I)-responsive transcriptional regulator [Lysobacter auxotrophicus]